MKLGKWRRLRRRRRRWMASECEWIIHKHTHTGLVIAPKRKLFHDLLLLLLLLWSLPLVHRTHALPWPGYIHFILSMSSKILFFFLFYFHLFICLLLISFFFFLLFFGRARLATEEMKWMGFCCCCCCLSSPHLIRVCRSYLSIEKFLFASCRLRKVACRDIRCACVCVWRGRILCIEVAVTARHNSATGRFLHEITAFLCFTFSVSWTSGKKLDCLLSFPDSISSISLSLSLPFSSTCDRLNRDVNLVLHIS